MYVSEVILDFAKVMMMRLRGVVRCHSCPLLSSIEKGDDAVCERKVSQPFLFSSVIPLLHN